LREIIGSLKQITDREGIQISEEGLFAVARESEGSLRDAQSLLDQVISYSGKEVRDSDIKEVLGLIDRTMLYETLEAIAERNAEKCAEVVENVYRFGYDLQHFCRELLQYLRNLILIKVSRQPEGLLELPQGEVELLKKQSEKFQFEQLNHLFTLLLKGEDELSQSVFPRIVLEITLIRMATLRPVLPIDEILRKLEGFGEIEEPRERTRVDLDKRTCETSGETEKGTAEQAVDAVASTSSQEAAGSERIEEEAKGGPRDSTDEQWKGLVDFTRAKSPVLGSFLAFGSLVYVGEDKIEIGFEKDSFHFDRMAEKENRGQLESICQEYLQRKVKLAISPLGQERNSRNRLAAGEDGGTKGAEENPLIQEALRIFNGKIVKGNPRS
jgi:DNA polymerase-3 subunit gamma/tau